MIPYIRAAFATALLSSACSHQCPVPVAPQNRPADAKPAESKLAETKPEPGLQYVGGTALQAKDPKALSAWYNDNFGLPMKGAMGSGFFGGFEWNETQFNIAIVPAGGKHPGSAPGTAYLVFHVGDFDQFIAAAAAKGVTPFETTSEDYGRFATFRDPEGNEVGVWGDPKPASQH